MDMSFLNKYFKDNKNWLVVSKNSARRGFVALGSNMKTVLGLKEE
jgi:hypothetical protein